MRILLDCRILSTDPSNGEKRLFLLSCVPVLAEKQGVEWVFLVNRNDPANWLPDIGSSVPVARTIPGWIGRRIWSRWQLPGMVKKLKPDLVMTADEITRVPGAADERYRSLSGEEKEEVKRIHSDGKEYFLAGVAGATPEEIVDLLKAFSLFKKRQRSNMQLVLSVGGFGGNLAHGHRIDLSGKLANYKYRADVHLYKSADQQLTDDPGAEWRRLMGAAYAFIPFTGKNTLGLEILNAWKAATPVITTHAASLQALQVLDGEGSLYPETSDPASLAALLMSLYTNEGLRAELIGKATNRVRSFSWERAAGQVWEGILRVTNTQ